MIRFVVGLIPSAVMTGAFALYVESSRVEDASVDLVRHTVVALRLADRMARDAGGDPDMVSLRAGIEKFAIVTGDNPAQVRAALAIREAVARDDMKGVVTLADVAAQEETQLLEERTVSNREKRLRSQAVIAAAFAIGILTSSILGIIAMVGRRLKFIAARDAREAEAG
jgi:ethanolamine utilization microcompartment shell protein EutL